MKDLAFPGSVRIKEPGENHEAEQLFYAGQYCLRCSTYIKKGEAENARACAENILNALYTIFQQKGEKGLTAKTAIDRCVCNLDSGESKPEIFLYVNETLNKVKS